MSSNRRSIMHIVLMFFFLSLGFSATQTNPAQAGQVAQSDGQKPEPEPKPAEEEHNDEDDC